MPVIVIKGLRPIPAPRPRVTRWGTYNDPKYTKYKEVILEYARLSRLKKMEGAIKISIMFQFKKPKSWSKKKRAGAYWHTSRPDTDNLIKGVKDALNGVAYKDDSQICDVDAVKVWGDCDMIVVELFEI